MLPIDHQEFGAVALDLDWRHTAAIAQHSPVPDFILVARRLPPDQVRDGDVEHDVIRYGGHVSGERLLLGALCALAEPQPGGAVRLVMRVRGSGRRRRWP
jgi:hypothetical protein